MEKYKEIKENLYQYGKRTNVLLKIAVILMVAAIILIQLLTPVGAVCVLAFFIVAVPVMSRDNKMKKLFGSEIVSSAVQKVYGNGRHQLYDKINTAGSVGMVFPFRYDKESGSNYIKANYNGVNVELSEIELSCHKEGNVSQGGMADDMVFDGWWLVCDFGRELAGEMRISANTKGLQGADRIENGDAEFDDRFCVFAKDPQVVHNMLTPGMRKVILSAADQCEGDLYMAFLPDGKVHITVNAGQYIINPERSRKENQMLQERIINDFRWFNAIIDGLHAEESIFKK